MDTREQIENVLEGMLGVEGITGVMVMDSDGVLLGSAMPSIFSEESLSEACDQMGNTILTLRELRIRPEELSYYYEDLRLIIKDLKKGFLVVLSQPSISIPLLNIATNIARKNIVNILKDGEKDPTKRAVASTRRVAVPAKELAPEPVPEPPPAAPLPVAVPPSPKSESRIASTPTTTTSLGLSPAALFERTPGMSPAMVVFNVLLREILSQSRSASIDSIDALFSTLLTASQKKGTSPAFAEQLREWCRSDAETQITEVIDPKAMSTVLHQLYISLCEYHGPVKGDRILKAAVRNTEVIAESREFSPKSLL